MGLALAIVVNGHPIGQPEPNVENVFFVLYGMHERVPLAAFVLFFVIAGIYWTSKPVAAWTTASRSTPTLRLPLALAAIGVGIIAWAGSRVFLFNFPLAMDEYSAVFQSRVFATGRVAAHVPVEWHDMIEAITPRFVTYLPESGAWLSGYLPAYAALRALFLAVNGAEFLNPLLGALSVIAIAQVGRRLWQGRDEWKLAVLLLITSSQFLITSMTSYSMPAHLLLSLCWLGLYVEGSRSALLALPWLGVIALGLHNPFPHALFVAPFLLRLARTKGPGLTAYFAAVYGGGAVAWWIWLSFSQPLTGAVAPAALFGLPGPKELLTQLLSVSLILSWQTPVFALGLAVTLLRWPRLSATQRDMAVGLILTFLFYAFFRLTQGHGWGYRYIYAVLGSAALLAADGLVALTRAFGAAPVMRVALASMVLTMVCQLPLRAIQVRRFTQPFAEGAAFVRSVPTPVVLIDTRAVWYGQDLLRNDPFLMKPVVISSSAEALAPDQLRRISAQFGPHLSVIRTAELEKIGLISEGGTR